MVHIVYKTLRGFSIYLERVAYFPVSVAKSLLQKQLEGARVCLAHSLGGHSHGKKHGS